MSNRNVEGQREATQITETSNYALLLNLQEICSFLTSLQEYSVLTSASQTFTADTLTASKTGNSLLRLRNV